MIRGENISYSAKKNKLKKEQLVECITELDRRLSVFPSPELMPSGVDAQMVIP